MKDNFKYTDDETEMMHKGADLFANKLKELLARREDLKFDWRKDIKTAIQEVEAELVKLENEQNESRCSICNKPCETFEEHVFGTQCICDACNASIPF